MPGNTFNFKNSNEPKHTSQAIISMYDKTIFTHSTTVIDQVYISNIAYIKVFNS
jgi:hypothetical protein